MSQKEEQEILKSLTPIQLIGRNTEKLCDALTCFDKGIIQSAKNVIKDIVLADSGNFFSQELATTLSEMFIMTGDSQLENHLRSILFPGTEKNAERAADALHVAQDSLNPKCGPYVNMRAIQIIQHVVGHHPDLLDQPLIDHLRETKKHMKDLSVKGEINKVLWIHEMNRTIGDFSGPRRPPFPPGPKRDADLSP